MNQATYNKEADAVLTYDIDMSGWLGARTISTATWTVPTGITKESESNTTTKVFIELSGGTWGSSYEISVHIVANDGSEQPESFTIKIQYDVKYCTRESVRALAQGMTASGKPPASDDLIDNLIERVSRLFDQMCGVAEGYFNEPLYPTATEHTFYGDGTNYLSLPPYIPGTLDTVSLPDEYSAPDYVAQNEHLIRTYSNHYLPPGPFRSYFYGWDEGVPVTVTAKWGFASTPADVKLAIIEWVINVWRETDPASLKLTNLDGSVLREAIPPRVKEVIKRYRMTQGAFV